MHLNIYSLKKILFRGEAESVNCKTESGEITVLDHHRPLISALAEGTIKLVDADAKEQYFPIRSGFLEVRAGNAVRLIVEEAR